MIETYYHELLRYLIRKTGDGHLAEDAAMETCARVLQHQREGRAITHPRAFLYQSARNLLASQARRQAAEARMLETLAITSADEAPSVERQVSTRQQLQRLQNLLDAMPAKRRSAFILVRILGMGYAEAAAHMEISEDAIEKHITRALMDCAGYASAQPARPGRNSD